MRSKKQACSWSAFDSTNNMAVFCLGFGVGRLRHHTTQIPLVGFGGALVANEIAVFHLGYHLTHHERAHFLVRIDPTARTFWSGLALQRALFGPDWPYSAHFLVRIN